MFHAQRKAELQQMALPSDVETCKRLRTFLITSGLTQGEFGEQIGYSACSIGLLLSGKYGETHRAESNTLGLRQACKQYMDLHATRADIRLRGRHYDSADYQSIRASALSALRKGTAYVVDGPPGTQKSWSLLNIQREVEQESLGRCIYVYARVNHSPQSFLVECCTAAGIPNHGRIDGLLRKLQFFLAGGRNLLLIDEGQHLNHASLEVLRQLLDLPPYFGVVIAGSHDLTQRLQHWQMEQWRRRVQKTHTLTGHPPQEARDILRAQLGIESAAEADAIIGDCMATATRTVLRAGKQVSEQYKYISAGLLFGFISGVLDSTQDIPQEAAA